MPIPTVSDIISDSAALLGDPAVERFTSSVLTPFFGMAYREMFDIMIRWRLPMVEKEMYARLLPYTTQLIPNSSASAIYDLGEPSRVSERGGLNSYLIVGHLPGGLTPGTQPTALATNDEVTASGFTYPPEANGKWIITVSGCNRTAVVPIVPMRGQILDRNGVVLATNYSAYTLEITPSRTLDLEATI